MRVFRVLGWIVFAALLAFVGPVVLAETQILTESSGVGDPFAELAELANLGDMLLDDYVSSGDSIRAKRDASKADKDRLRRLKDDNNITAKVEGTSTGHFPAVALRLKVIKQAKVGPGKDIEKNSKLVVVPYLKPRTVERVVIPYLKPVKGKRGIDMADEKTIRNAGSYYFKRGDKVKLQLGAKKGNAWVATYIERN